jgi:glycosyltransferase involved in cell wall biosynthesis
MKIAFVITKGTWGGAQKYVFDLSTHLKHSHDIVVIHGTPGLLVDKLKEQNIRTLHIPSLGRDINPVADIASFFHLIKIFRKEKPDVVHLNSSKIGGLGSLACRISGIKNIVFTVHGWLFNEDRNIISRAFIWIVSWLTALFSHNVIVLSNREKGQTQNMPGIYDKVHLIKNGIDFGNILDRNTARTFLKTKAPELSENAFWVGTISELHPNKGLMYAIQAIQELHFQNHDVFFIIIGDGKDHDHLVSSIKELHLEHRVFLLGAVPDAAQYLKAFDIFLLSSLKEGLPYAIIEAGAASVPVVATTVGGIPEMTDEGRAAFLIQPKSSSDITKALEALLANPTERNHLAERLHAFIHETYTVDKMVKGTVEVYQAVV